MARKLGLLCVFCSIAYCMFTQQKSDYTNINNFVNKMDNNSKTVEESIKRYGKPLSTEQRLAGEQNFQRLSHMSAQSVMSYLKLFGSDGVHLDYAQYDSRGNKIDPLKTMWNDLYPSKLRKDDNYGFPLGTGEYDLSV